MISPIKEILIFKAKTLIERQSLADAIEHNTTKGDLRESFLKDFILDIIPREFELTSGFVTSHNQKKLSPQIDIIVTDKSKTPKFLLNVSNSIVPFESALLLIEIKTTITEKVAEQIKSQRDFINDCGNPVFYRDNLLDDFKKIQQKTGLEIQANSNIFNKPFVWIIGFKSDLSEKRLTEIMQKVDGIAGIWLIDKYCLLPENGKIKKIESDKSTLFSIERILTIITLMQQERKYYTMNWTKYLIQ